LQASKQAKPRLERGFVIFVRRPCIFESTSASVGGEGIDAEHSDLQPLQQLLLQ